MKRLYWLTLIFAILFAVFFIGPALLGGQFGPYPLMKQGDVFDILTPLVLIPLYWLLLELSPEVPPSRGENLVFLVLAALWVEGQGMHLAANSIGHLLEGTEGTDVHTLTAFYDEVLSHFLWHLGVVGLSALLLVRQWRNPFAGEARGLALGIVAGLLYGFTFFLIVVEAGTVPLGLPFALLVVIFVLAWGRSRFTHQPLLLFFSVAYLVATLLLAGWGIYWGGWPEFSQVGLL